MLPPVEVHKAIQKKSAQGAKTVQIRKLANELKVEVEVLQESIVVLSALQLVEVTNEHIRLTPTGRLANL